MTLGSAALLSGTAGGIGLLLYLLAAGARRLTAGPAHYTQCCPATRDRGLRELPVCVCSCRPCRADRHPERTTP